MYIILSGYNLQNVNFFIIVNLSEIIENEVI